MKFFIPSNPRRWFEANNNRLIIDQQPQNKPSLIVRDLAGFGLPVDIAYQVLMKNGVFKWFAARRDIIKLKDRLKSKIRDTNKEIANLKQLAKYHYREMHRPRPYVPGANVIPEDEWGRYRAAHVNKFHQTIAARHHMRGYLKGLEEARAEIRDICHGPRWTVQDNDPKAAKWLETYERGEEWDESLWEDAA